MNNRHTDHFLAPNARPANDANVNTWREALVIVATYLLAPQFAAHVHVVQGVL